MCLWVHNPNAYSWYGMTDFSAPGAHLSKTSGAEVVRSDRNHRRAFGAPVALQGTDAERFIKSRRQSFGQFFGAGHHQPQAAEVFAAAGAHVELQERRRRQEKSDRILAHQWANGFGVERIRVIYHAHSQRRGQAKRAGKTERMKEGQNSQHSIISIESKDLVKLLNIRANIVMRKHHTLRFAGAAAGI